MRSKSCILNVSVNNSSSYYTNVYENGLRVSGRLNSNAVKIWQKLTNKKTTEKEINQCI